MKRAEFYDWLSQHKTRFSGLTKWLNDLRSSKEGVLERWAETLASLDVGDALEASKQMHAASEKDRPRKYEDHPGDIVRRSKELAVRRLRAVQPDGWRAGNHSRLDDLKVMDDARRTWKTLPDEAREQQLEPIRKRFGSFLNEHLIEEYAIGVLANESKATAAFETGKPIGGF